MCVPNADTFFVRSGFYSLLASKIATFTIDFGVALVRAYNSDDKVLFEKCL